MAKLLVIIDRYPTCMPIDTGSRGARNSGVLGGHAKASLLLQMPNRGRLMHRAALLTLASATHLTQVAAPEITTPRAASGSPFGKHFITRMMIPFKG